MICPYCSQAIHFKPATESRVYANETNIARLMNDPICNGIWVTEGFCPACNGFMVFLLEGNYDSRSGDLEKAAQTMLYPKTRSAKTLPAEIPQEYRDEFAEAFSVLDSSPKASAALSRRLLQNILQNHYGIKKKSLADEIKEFTMQSDIPSHLANAVDAVRQIGNFAAHPSKDVNTGAIVNVEPDEAEWLIDVLEALLDYAFVFPARLERQKQKLNEKLAAIGKPLLQQHHT